MTKPEIVEFAGVRGVDTGKICSHCRQHLWVVTDDKDIWTECGGIGEGSCEESFEIGSSAQKEALSRGVKVLFPRA